MFSKVRAFMNGVFTKVRYHARHIDKWCCDPKYKYPTKKETKKFFDGYNSIIEKGARALIDGNISEAFGYGVMGAYYFSGTDTKYEEEESVETVSMG